MTSREYTPRAYQKIIQHFAHEHARCGIFAGMGLGKTVSILTVLDGLFLSGEETKPALVIAPKRVAQSVWPDEAIKWRHLRDISVSPILGDVSERRRAMRRSASVYTINYDNIPWLMEELNGEFPFGTVIADESTRLKSFRLRQGGKRAGVLGRIAHAHARRWINLTGTPNPNGLGDLWGQSWFIDSGLRLGRSYDGFSKRWFRPSYDGHSIEPLPHAFDEIIGRLKDVCVSMEAKDYFPVDAPIITPVYVELPTRARKLYKDMEKDYFAEIDGNDVEAFNAAAKRQKLLQLANGAVYVDEEKNWKEVHDAKIQALESIANECGGAPILVAYHFKSDLARLRAAFPRARVLDNNPQTIRDWNAGKINMLFAHPQSAGHGLNLQDGGNIIVHFTITDNLEAFLQINERLGPVRQKQAGHDRCVFEYRIVARDTVDEIIIARNDGKGKLQDLTMAYLKQQGV